eukprot:CAMPEP_0119038806 /NCGR_PEP_ID=MMETSP1177-20130426/7931_1 /TAXON_ID=2985 /ORGANISM="Ochromonas sp, Strain CCMP1899" /LENGTH=503 /DNA_ID=CAMNT_0007001847 /DNA_START=406 /DNA_END=1917 /DNA_ORIENTATION=-
MLHGRGTPLGVQDLTFEGPNGQFWVKCFYPTRVADKEKADDFPSDNRGTMKLFLSLAIIMLSLVVRIYLETIDQEMKMEKEDILSLISFYFFPIIHLIRLLYDIKYALPSSAYISTMESTQVLNGIASFGKLPQFLFQHMKHMTINCTEDAPVCLKKEYKIDENGQEKQMKVAFLIHGLGGNRSLYSHICMRLASEGYFVICPEFGDRTAAFTVLAGGDVRKYTAYTFAEGEAELSEGNRDFRRNQLEHRAAEMSIIVQYFSSLGTKAGPQALVRWSMNKTGGSFFVDSLSMGKKDSNMVSLDISHPYLVGHSFGGASAIHLQRSQDKEAVHFRSLIDRISGVAALDPWMWPLGDVHHSDSASNFDKPIHKAVISSPSTPTPYLVMHSEYFQWPANLTLEKSLIKVIGSVVHICVRDAGHHNFSDTGFLAPIVTGSILKPRKTGLQDPEPLQDLINDMLIAFLEDVDDISSPAVKGKTDIDVELRKSLALAQNTASFEILEAK